MKAQIEYKKKLLWQQLERMGCAWSYAKDASVINDEILIEKALVHLEFEDLYKICEIYPMQYIRSIWRKNLVSQGDYYEIINWLLAAMFFKIKKPDKYLRRYGKRRMEIRS